MTTPCRISSAASSDERASPPGCLRRLPGTKLNSPSRLGAGSRIHANPALCVGGCEAQCLLDGSNREPHFAPLGAADGLHGSALSPRLRARLLDAQSPEAAGVALTNPRSGLRVPGATPRSESEVRTSSRFADAMNRLSRFRGAQASRVSQTHGCESDLRTLGRLLSFVCSRRCDILPSSASSAPTRSRLRVRARRVFDEQRPKLDRL
jgi:hypothetical protein